MDCSITTQDSLPDGWPALPGGVGYPLGPNERFQVILPPFPGFAWRTENDKLRECVPFSVIPARGWRTEESRFFARSRMKIDNLSSIGSNRATAAACW
jgi:hypothetical protein